MLVEVKCLCAHFLFALRFAICKGEFGDPEQIFFLYLVRTFLQVYYHWGLLYQFRCLDTSPTYCTTFMLPILKCISMYYLTALNEQQML